MILAENFSLTILAGKTQFTLARKFDFVILAKIRFWLWRKNSFCHFGRKSRFRGFGEKIRFAVLARKPNFEVLAKKLNLLFWQKNSIYSFG